MLDISTNIVHKAFDEDAHKVVIVENVAALQHPFGQFVSVLLDAKLMLAQATLLIVPFNDDVGPRVRAQHVMHSLRIRRNLLILGTQVSACIHVTS